MNTFDAAKHPRGGHADNPGKFSVAELDEVALADLDALSNTGADEVLDGVRDAIVSGELSGDAQVIDDKVAFRDRDGSTYLVGSNGNSVWAWPAEGSEFEAEYFDAPAGKTGAAAVKAIRSARAVEVSRRAWRESVLAYSALSQLHGGVFVKDVAFTDDTLTINSSTPIFRARFSGFEARDEIHDGRASVSVQLSDANSDHSYVITCDPETEELAVFRGYDIEPLPHWEAQAVHTQIRSRTGFDERDVANMLATPARAVAAADAPPVPA